LSGENVGACLAAAAERKQPPTSRTSTPTPPYSYGGTHRLLNQVRARTSGFTVVKADLSDPAAARAAILAPAGDTKVAMVWVETPTNPTLKLADIAAIAELAAEVGAIVVVDNTFATPALTRWVFGVPGVGVGWAVGCMDCSFEFSRWVGCSMFSSPPTIPTHAPTPPDPSNPCSPLELGADVVLSSTTKYIAGHSDTVGGALATRRAALAKRLRFLQNAAGAIMSPWDAYLALRGAKTLHVRMQRHCDNALELARRLEARSDAVVKVVYPGLPSHPQHALAARQMRLASAAPGKAPGASAPAFGGMISLTLRGGLAESRAFLEALHLFALAESLGGVESLAEHPAIMTHGSVPAAERAALGISDAFVRLSVGIEHVEDLWADLEGALAAAAAVYSGKKGKAAGAAAGAVN
jgi:cystathionine gamma-lyase